MVKDFAGLEKYIEEYNLFDRGSKLLIAVSGGMDSMLLVNFLHKNRYQYSVAHCNFNLRGSESDEDEKLVADFCKKHNRKYHLGSFNTAEFAKEKGISIQMAARRLRYDWFDGLMLKYGYDVLITAHHKTDHVETVLLNMLRGTGNNGLEGLYSRNSRSVKPLLYFNREEIKALVKSLKITYREDNSNSSIKYSRNQLRHRVLPLLRSINPTLEKTFEQNAIHVVQSNSFIEHYLGLLYKDLVVIKDEETWIDKQKLMQCPQPDFVLYSLLRKFNFNRSITDSLFACLNEVPGKVFYNHEYRIVTAHKDLIVQKLKDSKYQEYPILEDTHFIETETGTFRFEIRNEKKVSGEGNVATLDFRNLKFPLTLRRWQKGDRMKPLGMSGHKKLSDIFTDLKLSLPQKEKVWVLTSDKDVVWVVGFVISEDHKIRKDTNKQLFIEFNPFGFTRHGI